jgi:SAM-dependent methyltransferase
MGENANTGRASSLLPAYFERMYRRDRDPWDFATSAYEHAKYTATLAALPRPRYERAFEVGCSIGVLTHRLAARCDRLLAVDVADDALAQARARCRDLGHVHFERMQIPERLPDATFDLVLLSEVGYYWSPEALAQAHRALTERLAPGGHLLLVHWTPHVTDYPLTGDAVHEHFLAQGPPALRHRHGERAERYRLDFFERA